MNVTEQFADTFCNMMRHNGVPKPIVARTSFNHILMNNERCIVAVRATYSGDKTRHEFDIIGQFIHGVLAVSETVAEFSGHNVIKDYGAALMVLPAPQETMVMLCGVVVGRLAVLVRSTTGAQFIMRTDRPQETA